MSIVLVATPSRPDGSFSLDYVLGACEDLGEALADKEGYHLVVIASTVMPGACEGPIRQALERSSGKRVGAELGLCACPEFVALGQVIEGFQRPDFVLIGAWDEKSGEILRGVYERFVANGAPVVVTNLVNAELAKIALNTYLTTKISFANQVGEICERLRGADAGVVLGVLGRDKRVNPLYLKAATAYGGPCFPRDDRALQALAKRVETDGGLARAVELFNQGQRWRLRGLVDKELHKLGKGPRLGLLGLAFKPGTDCTLESVGLDLLRAYASEEVGLVCYDPQVVVGSSTKSAQACVERADLVVVTTPDPAFREVTFRAGQTVIDCWRLYGRDQVEEAGAKYYGLGLGRSSTKGTKDTKE